MTTRDGTRPGPGPLTGLVVVAVEQAVAAPLCSRHLADLGAEVIKLERLDGGDFARDYDQIVQGESSQFVWLNRGKRSVALNLKSESGIEILTRLLDGADVLLSNLGPGAMERLVPDELVVQRNPRLIRCAISGYGPSGPYRDRKAFDLLVQGESGVTMSTGLPGEPAKPGVSIADLGAGIYAVAAILAALHERHRTGLGSKVNVSMFDVLTEWMSPILLAERAGVTLEPCGARHPTITPYGPYETSDGELINLAVQNDAQWRRLCSVVLDLPGAATDPRFATNTGRQAHRPEVERLVADRVRRLDRTALEGRVVAADVPWGRLNRPSDVLVHPQLDISERWVDVRLPNGGKTRLLAGVFGAITGVEGFGSRQVPGLGEDTHAVLEQLGIGQPERAALAREGVIADRVRPRV